MQFAGRRIISTTLDPVPRSFRASPGVLALNYIEAQALKNGHGPTFKVIMAICHAEDMADAMRTFKRVQRKVTAKTEKIRPSDRMAMLNAVYRKELPQPHQRKQFQNQGD